MWTEFYYFNIARRFLPPMSKILFINKKPAIIHKDLDGDGLGEMIVAYKWMDAPYFLILKNYNTCWYYFTDAYQRIDMLKKARKAINRTCKMNYPCRNLSRKLREETFSKSEKRFIMLYPASIKTVNGTKWGYIDHNGSFKINPQYNFAMNFQSNSLAIVEKNNLSGLINEFGAYVVKPKYSSIYEFSEARASVIDDAGFKIIDESGKILTSKAYSYIGSFHEGRALFSNNDKNNNSVYGYLDRTGKEIIPPKYQAANDFNSGKALVKINDNLFALINLKGETINTYAYPFMSPSGDNLLIFSESLTGKAGYLDESGKVVLPPKYATALPFNNGRAVVNMSDTYINKYGLIDEKGNFIITPIYNDIKTLGQNRLAVGKAIDEKQPFIGSKYAIADTDGLFLTAFIYNNVEEYENGLASTSDDKNTFFIDISGNLAKNLPVVPGNGTLRLQGVLIQANVDMRLSYLTNSGKVIWSQNTIIPLNNLYSVLEEKYKPNRDYLVYYPQIKGIENKQTEIAVNTQLKALSKLIPLDSMSKLDYSYYGDFSIEFFKKNLLVLELNGYNYPFGAAHGMPTKIYPHINLVNGKFYKLQDLFKQNSDYVKVISDIIANQIKTNKDYSYIFPDTYKGIQPDQPFYVNETTLFIYFEPYEIAPYVAGFPTFKIPFAEIKNIIATEGDFWRAFHY